MESQSPIQSKHDDRRLKPSGTNNTMQNPMLSSVDNGKFMTGGGQIEKNSSVITTNEAAIVLSDGPQTQKHYKPQSQCVEPTRSEINIFSQDSQMNYQNSVVTSSQGPSREPSNKPHTRGGVVHHKRPHVPQQRSGVRINPSIHDKKSLIVSSINH